MNLTKKQKEVLEYLKNGWILVYHNGWFSQWVMLEKEGKGEGIKVNMKIFNSLMNKKLIKAGKSDNYFGGGTKYILV